MSGDTKKDVARALAELADPIRASNAQRYFKTGIGEYGEGDRFLGVTVPNQRAVARRYRDLSLVGIERLLASPVHEHRLTGLFILVRQYEQADDPERQQQLAEFYLAHRAKINNWDLVDSSAPHILGGYYKNRDRQEIFALARSRNIWDRRIAVLTTLAFIVAGDFADTFRLVESLLTDKEELIHKAAGWMLREIGKRDQNAERYWLDAHYQKMPRTMLRYAIEKFPPQLRDHYLAR